MKHKLLFITFLVSCLSWGQTTDLIISEYVEGSSSNKYIELYNGTGATVDLSNYKLRLYSNGSATPSEVTLSGSLLNNQTIVYKNSGATIFTGTATVNASVNYNGDDAVVLYKISTNSNVDIFGVIGSDPGSAWAANGFSTVDKTLRRKSSVCGGITVNPTGTGATAFTTLSTEWDIFNNDDVSDIGNHTANCNAPTSTTYTTSWSNSAPTSSIDAIIDGNLTTSADLACKDLTINANKTLTIAAGNKLTVSGNLINNGTIVFKSNASATAMFDVFNGTQSGSGVVTTERYIPAKRAFRFLSPSVTTSTSIKLNWQENAGTTAGLGTHITGVDGTTNGFDATATNNPSLYTFNNSTGAWVAVTSTLTNFAAGTPYRLMVRGDRLINLTTNTPTATETVLRATGTLYTGNFSPTLNQAAEGFSFVGNPYQAPVNIKTVLDAATNMNTGVVYYWDPTLNARGGYVTRDLTNNNNTPTSSFNQYLQPGQAVFVKKANTAPTATMTFTESHKAVANAAAGVFRTVNTSAYGLLRVNLQANTNNQWQTIEGTLALFNDNYSWNVTSEDATKMANLDEEVSFVQNNTSLAIACQPNPTATTELPIRLTNTRYTNYQWQFDLDNYDGATPYLFDTLNNSYTQINNGTLVPFIADANTTNRFKIVFQNAVLSNTAFQNTLAIYPNPAKAGASFYVEGISEATVTVSNLLGQNVPVQTKNQGTTLQVTPNTNLSQGMYLVNITTQGTTQQVKWIVE